MELEETNEPDQLVFNPLTDNFNGEKTLETNPEHLLTQKYDLEFEVDPLFQKRSAQFDDSSYNKLMLNSVAVSSEMEIQFSANTKVPLSRKGDKSWLELCRSEIPARHELFNARVCNDLAWFKEELVRSLDYNELLEEQKTF